MLRPTPIVRSLLQWFTVQARDLPWRRTRDPYAIWISEVMLQQTQVATVRPYFERWMRALPTIADLSSSSIDRVLKLWEGLGYYIRARNAQRAAQTIVARHQGEFPREFADVLALPGVGRYTAGAICSLAFNQPTPAVDGNVARVLARLFGIHPHPREPEANARLWSLAGQLVTAAQRSAFEWPCGRLNEALIELGALVCTPRQPRCPACPVRRFCFAWKHRCVDRIPAPRVRPRARSCRVAALVVQHRGRVLVRRRAQTGLNAGLWEFPQFEPRERQGWPAVLSARTGIPSAAFEHLGHIKHSITRHRFTLEVYRTQAALPAGVLGGTWRTLRQLDALAFTAAHRRIIPWLTRTPD